jgi:hypothetical protein
LVPRAGELTRAASNLSGAAASQAGWIRIVSSMPRAGDDLMNFVVDPNTTGVERVGIIRIGPLTLTIRQTP